MTTYTVAQGTRSSSVLDIGTLADGTYVTSTAVDLGATIPEDVTWEFVVNANGTPTGNKQYLIFLKLSLDNTNWGSGPESGTTTTEEADLHPLGILPCNDTNDHRKFFSQALAGIPITRYVKVVVKNNSGVAATSGNVYRADITGTGT